MNLLAKTFILGILSFSFIDSSFLQAVNKEISMQKWKEFQSEEGGFSIELPKTPEHVRQKIDIPKTDLSISYDTFVSEPNDSVVYVISVWHYPEEIDMSKPDINLKDGFNGMLSALPGSKVLNMEMTKVSGFKALEFLVKNDDIYFEGQLILVHNTLYQVFTVFKEDLEQMKDDYSHFVESFKLINPEQHQVKTADEDEKFDRMNV